MIHNIELGCRGKALRSPVPPVPQQNSSLRTASFARSVCRAAKSASFLENRLAVIGQVSNIDHMNESSGSAGRSRWLGIRPSVRGVAMNWLTTRWRW